MSTRLSPQSLDRAVGAALGSAAGDALGADYEFGPAVSGDIVMSGGGAFGWAPGEWTDDTQMATAILTAAATARARGSFEVDEVAAGFLAWLADGPKDVGNQTRSVLGSARSPAALAEAAVRFQARSPDSAGNGGLMRTGPVALASLAVGGDEAMTSWLAADIARLSHPHEDVVAAAVLWSTANHRLVVDTSITPAGSGWADLVAGGLAHLDGPTADRWSRLIAAAAQGPPDRFADRNGWVVAAFQQALATLVAVSVPGGAAAPRHLRLVLEAAVRPGRDADTVAAITGSLAGAAWGATAVPGRWRRLLHGDLVSAAEVVRADGRRLEQLARIAATGHDAQGWPGIDRLVPYYLQTLRPPRRYAQVAEHLAVGTTADLEQLPLDDRWTVVSLCRMGEIDLPAEVERIEVGLIDSDTANAHLAWVLADTANVIEACREEGREVFVHCVAGETRSPAALAVWLARHGSRTANDALAEAQQIYRATLRPTFIDAVVEAAHLSPG